MADLSGRKQRGGGRQWKRGESGNPNGRPKGSGQAAKLREAISQDVPDIIAKLATLAKGGDVAAARLLLDRAVPALRPESQPVEIPGLASGSLTERAEAAIAAAGRGEVPADLAAQLVAAVGALARITEVAELEQRIASLEAKHENH